MESEIWDKYSTFGSLRRIKDIRKVDGEADLCAETGTGDEFASEHSKQKVNPLRIRYWPPTMPWNCDLPKFPFSV